MHTTESYNFIPSVGGASRQLALQVSVLNTAPGAPAKAPARPVSSHVVGCLSSADKATRKLLVACGYHRGRSESVLRSRLEQQKLPSGRIAVAVLKSVVLSVQFSVETTNRLDAYPPELDDEQRAFMNL